ncbi:MAG: MFS transporter [Caldilineaceae bacterium]
MFALLRHRNFALLWWGGLISITGNRVLTVAVPYYIYAQTGSTLVTAAMMLAMIVPSMLFSSIAGVFVDRWDRRQIMLVTNFILVFTLLPLLFLQRTGWTWLIYIVAFLEATVSTFFYPAENALLPQVVGKDQLLAANTLNSLNNTLAGLIGPALGGILLGRWGLEFVVLFDCLSYLLAGLCVYFVNLPPELTQTRSPETMPEPFSWRKFWSEWYAGVALIRRKRVIAILFVVASLSALGGTMLDPLVAPFMQDILQISAETFGWILTLGGIAGTVGGFLIGQFSAKVRPAMLYSISSILNGVLLLLMYRSNALTVVIALGTLSSLISIGSRVAMPTLLQENVEDAYRGRVFGTLDTTIAILVLLGVGFSGIMGERIGIVPVLSIGSGIMLAAGLASLWLLLRKPSARENTRQVTRE